MHFKSLCNKLDASAKIRGKNIINLILILQFPSNLRLIVFILVCKKEKRKRNDTKNAFYKIYIFLKYQI